MNGILGVARRVGGYGLLVAGVAGSLLQVGPGLLMLVAAILLIGFNDPILRPWLQFVRRWRLPSA